MRSREVLVNARHAAMRKARFGMIAVVAAGVAVSFWIRFFRGLSRSGEQRS
ncbi:hypothetical protein [Pseudolabrys sp. FHR47]|uniref:hypothetical protein n=1 Tax=Pseudolabrys sp. FHR47 TaxID=2562284 RepID=UPI00143CD862|nr:hypothetical protein [Pseudolabrys sp. FHR47]